MYKELVKKTPFFFHMAYLCRAWEDSCDFTLDMLKCNTKHTLYYLRAETFALVVCAVGHLLQLAPVSPMTVSRKAYLI